MVKKIPKSYHSNLKIKGIPKIRSRSQRSTMIALVLIFAVSGAYFVFKSYAATAGFTYNVANGSFREISGGAYVTSSSKGKGKAGESVLVMPAETAKIKVSSALQGSEISIPARQRFRFCVITSGADPKTVNMKSTFGSDEYGSQSFSVGAASNTIATYTTITPLPNNFSEICSPEWVLPVRLYGPVSLENLGPALSLSSYTIKYVPDKLSPF